MTPAPTPSSPAPLTLRKIVTLCTVGGFLDGYTLLMMSAALLLLIPEFAMSPRVVGLVTALPFLGMALGSLIAGPVTDRFGRRPVFIVDLAVFLVLAVLLSASRTVVEIGVLRFILGVTIGADMPTSSSMLAEFSPARIRGAVTSLFNTVWLLGFVAAGLVGYLLYQYAGPHAWRWMFLSAAVPALAAVGLRRDIPETPYWLRAAGRVAEAELVEARLRAGGTAAVPTVSAAARLGDLRELLVEGRWKVVAFFAAYWFIQSIAGAPLLSYTAVIFHRVIKFSGGHALLFTVALSVLYVIFSLIVQFTVLERRGRKTVALWTLSITAVGCVATALLVTSTSLLVLAYAVAIIGSQLTVIPYWPWSVEQTPTRIRATGQAIGNFGGKLGAFIGVFWLPTFLKAAGWRTGFLSLAGVFLLVLALTVVFGRETRGRALSAAEGSFAGGVADDGGVPRVQPGPAVG